MEAVAASAPCREEKKVPTRAGSAEPVKIPVMFYTIRLLASESYNVGVRVLERKTYVDKP
jgi:hypothetical protein